MSLCVQKKRRNKFTGVSFSKQRSQWIAQVTHEKKRYFCGSFSTELEAAQAVNAKCVELDIPLKNPEIGLLEYEPKVSFILKTRKLKKVIAY